MRGGGHAATPASTLMTSRGRSREKVVSPAKNSSKYPETASFCAAGMNRLKNGRRSMARSLRLRRTYMPAMIPAAKRRMVVRERTSIRYSTEKTYMPRRAMEKRRMMSSSRSITTVEMAFPTPVRSSVT